MGPAPRQWGARPALSGSDQMRGQLLLRRIELDGEGVDASRGRLLRAQRPDALPRAPNVAPGLRLRVRVGAEVHLRRIGLGQIVRVEARGDDRTAQIVALDAGEVVRVHNV